MAVVTIARIQHRRGVKSDLPSSLNEGELGWCLDTRELFIGNSQAVGGNTQILTTASNLAQIAQYSFFSSTQVPSVTGESAAQPIVRSLQNQVDDYWVNVRAYGAQGDGITDDTDAINRAIEDLYTKVLTSDENPLQTQKAIWFPSGTYLISEPIVVFPGVRLVGEHENSVKIILDNTTVLQPCVLRLSDGNAQTGASIGNNGAVLPTNIVIQDLALHAANNETVVLLERCENVSFCRVTVSGTWSSGDGVLSGQQAVAIETLGSAIATGSISFDHVTFKNVVWGLHLNDPVEHISFDRCCFCGLYRALWIGDAAVLNGPSWMTVSNSLFRDIDDSAIVIESSNPGIASSHNVYDNVGELSSVPCVAWRTGTTICSSIGDRFSRLGNPPAVARILNQEPGSNMIANAQDSWNQPVP
jgi:hypothetical protein